MGSLNQETPFVGADALQEMYGTEYNKTVARMEPEFVETPRPEPTPPVTPALPPLQEPEPSDPDSDPDQVPAETGPALDPVE